ncbi:DNA polymerase III subunit gamma/tau [Bifidobacterium sp.]|jgi:DNA polymerase-3 subunit gamma/tau|uniref:DNA polymerase III subunit gamma/tau n=1 Tax=Bifidobacterium sp. TaxID=41200 RepID=UPI0025BFF2C8|nr:DNA polymerase III subunit gamma/tau [Bifidobacterium sp.]MCH4209085.1 DNA polymerase III subunit gamma/tau [Bifidobacterium sp.]MCI1224734.1 DNA polymerase III subunit gamma/tau [Bifidobacterium sp.]
MALALYRRYRPDTFAGVIGQDQVTVPLSRALDEGKLTHAYLFSGPRGCGKTSSARILARCINCEQGPTSHPCGECESCRDLATGGPGSIDVVEIDAASHNGVDDARELRERATFAPARDRYKIFILDEAHMVTQQGFNALLKIVEEPPEHVMFIFATTEPEKVIGTIRSRTHHYPFRLVPTEVMGPYLQGICRQEHIETEPGVLKIAMRAGGGSVRDTLSVLDQLMVGSVNGTITRDSAISLLGFTPDALIGEAIDAVIGRDGGKLYGVVQKVVVGGFDPRRFVEDLLSRVRDLLVLTLGGERAESMLGDDSAAEDMKHLRMQASALGLTALSTMAETINAALAAMTGAVSPRMRLELLAARLLAGRDPQTTLIVGTTNAHADADGIASAPGAAGHSGRDRQGSARSGFAGSNRRNAPGQTNATPNAVAQRNTEPISASVEHAGAVHAAANMPAAAEGFESASVAASADAGASVSPASQTAARGASPATNAAPAASQGAGDGAVSVADARSVDERWDAVVAALPDDVREYVTRDKVVRVALASNSAGKQRVAMTFDRPLSQHAFALAVSSDQEHQGRKAAKVVLAGVRTIFGENTMIAPTTVAANGERVEPTARMDTQQLAQVKKQIVMEKAGLASAGLAAHVAPHASGHPKEGKTPAADGSDNSDEPVHRTAQNNQEGATAHEPAAGLDNEDPWLHSSPTVQVQDAGRNEHEEDGSVSAVDAGAAGKGPAEPNPLEQSPAVSQFLPREQQQQPLAGSSHGPQHAQPHHRHVAVPDMSNDEDPWSMPPEPMPDDEIEGIAPPDRGGGFAGHNGAHDQDEDPWAVQPQNLGVAMEPGMQSDAWPGGRPHVQADTQSASGFAVAGRLGPDASAVSGQSAARHDADNEPHSSSAAATAGPDTDAAAVSSAPNDPQVASEDDEYSLNDESLGAATAMGLEEIEKLFEVKGVEDFAADDPHNPRNIQPPSKARKQQEN